MANVAALSGVSQRARVRTGFMWKDLAGPANNDDSYSLPSVPTCDRRRFAPRSSGVSPFRTEIGRITPRRIA